MTIGLLSTSTIAGYDWNGNFCPSEYDYEFPAMSPVSINPIVNQDVIKELDETQIHGSI